MVVRAWIVVGKWTEEADHWRGCLTGTLSWQGWPQSEDPAGAADGVIFQWPRGVGVSINYVRILPYTQQQAEECSSYTYGYLRIRPRQDMTSPNDASRSNSRLTDGSRRSSFGSTTSNAAEVSVFCITHHYIVVGDWKFCVAFHHALHYLCSTCCRLWSLLTVTCTRYEYCCS